MGAVKGIMKSKFLFWVMRMFGKYSVGIDNDLVNMFDVIH